MKEFTRKVLLAVAPFFGTLIAIVTVKAAHVPFPAPLSWEALPQWAVFVAVSYTCNVLCTFIVGRIFGATPLPCSVATDSTA